MKVQQIFNFVKQKINFAQNRNTPDLTSFGSQQNVLNDSNTQLISKDAAEALKSKYMSNVSFEGVSRSVEVEEFSHNETRTEKVYGTSGYLGERNYSERKIDGYQARIAGARGKSSIYSSIDSAVEDAIRHSNYYRSGSRIKRNGSIYIQNNFPYRSNGVGNIYFSDPYEEVKSSDRRGNEYIVYAPGAKDADERSAWKKFWD